jgi:hypothetical protein
MKYLWQVAIAFILIIVGVGNSGCLNNTQVTVEWTQAPVNLTVSREGSVVLLTFNAANEENGFAGYGIFFSTEQSALDEIPPNQQPTEFCPTSSGTLNALKPIQIRLGADKQSDEEFCALSAVVIPAGNYVAVRAYVNRDDFPWSRPVIGRVP